MNVWLNGELTAEKSACISPTDRGFTLGDGVFDTLLAIDGKPVEAAAHTQRLRSHAAAMRIPFTMDDHAFASAILSLLKQNDFLKGRYAIRTTLTRGPGVRGLAPPDNPSPTLLIRAVPAPDPSIMPPVRIIVAQTVRRNENSPLSRIKSLNYGDNVLALMEAKAKGADDAILLNTAGRIACATASNIFIVKDGKTFTPPLSDGVMDGIERRGIRDAIERSLSPDDLFAADSVFLTNSITGKRPALPTSC